MQAICKCEVRIFAVASLPRGVINTDFPVIRFAVCEAEWQQLKLQGFEKMEFELEVAGADAFN
jgi:hypothetical protein